MDPQLEEIKIEGYDKVVKVTEPDCGLLAIISMHDRTLGPAVGGIRFRNYPTFDDALDDVLRLSKGMTYKFAMLPCGWGGGKSVVITDPKTGKTPELLRAFGKAIEMLEGKYIGAEDSGCSTADLDLIHEETAYLIGLQNEKGAGNPAPFTAWGTFRGIEAALLTLNGSSSLEDKVIAIQGVGMVGEALAEHLFWRGARLVIADVNEEACKRVSKKYGATICDVQEILKVECDVLAPCAFGSVINSQSILDLRCKIIAGCANNQLRDNTDSELLAERGVLYVPDFVINGGGAINCVNELEPGGYNSVQSRLLTDRIFDQVLKIFAMAKKNGGSTLQAALEIADQRLMLASKKKLTEGFLV